MMRSLYLLRTFSFLSSTVAQYSLHALLFFVVYLIQQLLAQPELGHTGAKAQVTASPDPTQPPSEDSDPKPPHLRLGGQNLAIAPQKAPHGYHNNTAQLPRVPLLVQGRLTDNSFFFTFFFIYHKFVLKLNTASIHYIQHSK